MFRFRVRVMNGAMNDLGGVNTGAIISEAVQTQVGDDL